MISRNNAKYAGGVALFSRVNHKMNILKKQLPPYKFQLNSNITSKYKELFSKKNDIAHENMLVV